MWQNNYWIISRYPLNNILLEFAISTSRPTAARLILQILAKYYSMDTSKSFNNYILSHPVLYRLCNISQCEQCTILHCKLCTILHCRLCTILYCKFCNMLHCMLLPSYIGSGLFALSCSVSSAPSCIVGICTILHRQLCTILLCRFCIILHCGFCTILYWRLLPSFIVGSASFCIISSYHPALYIRLYIISHWKLCTSLICKLQSSSSNWGIN